jgi:hypothetical protein
MNRVFHFSSFHQIELLCCVERWLVVFQIETEKIALTDEQDGKANLPKSCFMRMFDISNKTLLQKNIHSDIF